MPFAETEMKIDLNSSGNVTVKDAVTVFGPFVNNEVPQPFRTAVWDSWGPSKEMMGSPHTVRYYYTQYDTVLSVQGQTEAGTVC